jgi:outer membrane biosynthesis protein TonB
MVTPNGDRIQLTPLQRRLVGAVAAGGAVIATIGFVGSYAAVRALAVAKGFGNFALFFPVGIDAGILVLLALDLLLTWLRMPLAMLRHAAWLLTAATIAFNAAVAWPDPVGTGMHAVIPVLFVVVVEAARHAIGQVADITAGRHMESVRLSRWLLDPVSTFRLWRRMKLWELRSYEQVIKLEQQRLIERARLRSRYGRQWRSKAPVDAVLALRLTRYGRAVGTPIEGVLNLEHAPAGAARAAVASAPAAVIESSSTFDVVAEQAIEVVHPQPQPDVDAQPGAAAAAQPSAQPVVQPQPSAQPVVQPQPQPQPVVQPVVQPQPVTQPVVQPVAQPQPQPKPKVQPKPHRKVTKMRTPEEMAQLLEKARALNAESLRDNGSQASLRTLQRELGIGQRTAQNFQLQLPKTLAAAVAEAQPDTKEA